MSFVKEVKDIKRLKQIIQVLFKYEFGYILHKTPLAIHLPRKTKTKSNPANLRIAFEELGGAFIKLGQLLSLRPDLITKEYSEEFAKLQDNIPEFPYSQVKQIVEKELGPIIKSFKDFAKKPIAAASIGQVHQATLLSGKKVVVKVKRPGVEEQFKADIDLLDYLASVIKKHSELKIVDPVQVVEEFKKYTKREMDYLKEAKNIDIFAANFAANPNVKIPKVYWEYTTANIITTEYIHGSKISESTKLTEPQKRKIIKILANCFFTQIFEHGLFHADPHPANILIINPNTIALIDFGIVGFIEDHLRSGLSDLFSAAIINDPHWMAESLIDLGMFQEPVNTQALEEELVEQISEYRDLKAKYIDLAAFFFKFLTIAKEHKMVLPVNFVLLGKTIATLESTCMILDPDITLLEVAKPYVEKMQQNAYNPLSSIKQLFKSSSKLRKLLLRIPEHSEQLLLEIKDGDRTIKSIEHDVKSISVELNKTRNTQIFGIITAALLIGGALMIHHTERLIMGIPLYSAVYFLLAALIICYLIITKGGG
ncbi:MAG: AarF/UbiB family protein [Candidatus Woesearchaeota archaeon]